jgi:hypothetical protein
MVAAGLVGLSMMLGKLKSAVEDGSKLFTMARNGSFWAWRHLSIGGRMHRAQEDIITAMRDDMDARLKAIEADYETLRAAVAPQHDDHATPDDIDGKRREVLRLIADILGVPAGDTDG